MSVLHVHDVDSVSVHHQVAMMCMCCMFMMLIPTVDHQVAMMCLCCMLMVLTLSLSTTRWQ